MLFIHAEVVTHVASSPEHWFSTFFSSRHTNFVQKFGGTPKCKKEQNEENNAIFCVSHEAFKVVQNVYIMTVKMVHSYR